MNTLLVVDDEVAFAEFVGKVGAAADYDVRMVNSVAAFRHEIQSEWPSVLILDLQMPDADGFELLREIAERRCPSKVIVASGLDGRILESALRLGSEIGLDMAGKVAKPVRAPDLKRMLAALRCDGRPTVEDLAAAMDRDQLFLLYQPKFDIRTRHMVGVEALVRWRNESGVIIPPDRFIPLAESSGLMDRLTSWVVEAAFRQAGQWLRRGLRLRVAVNLSAVNLHDRQLPDRLAALCVTSGIKPDDITLELTETASSQDHTTILEILGRFRLKGFHLSIDDFGTGYSSVAQLLRLPFSELKVDKSFVSQMLDVRDARVVARTIVQMAQNMDLSTVAEGVESEAVLEMLNSWGCDIAQGYLFSKPVEAPAIEAMAAAAKGTGDG